MSLGSFHRIPSRMMGTSDQFQGSGMMNAVEERAVGFKAYDEMEKSHGKDDGWNTKPDQTGPARPLYERTPGSLWRDDEPDDGQLGSGSSSCSSVPFCRPSLVSVFSRSPIQSGHCRKRNHFFLTSCGLLSFQISLGGSIMHHASGRDRGNDPRCDQTEEHLQEEDRND